MSVFVQQSGSECEFSNSDSWVILSPIEQSIKRKKPSCRDSSQRLGHKHLSWSSNWIVVEAFIISTEKRDEILANCQTEDERARTAELIRPILRGRDIKRYGYNWTGLYLIATFPSRHYDIEKYPAVKNYLLGFGIERLEQNGEVSHCKWRENKSEKEDQ